MFLRGVAQTGLAIPRAVKRLDGSAITSGTWTIYITIDGGTQTTIAGSATHEGNGQWTFNLTAAEMDGELIALTFVHTDASPATITIRTLPVISGTAQAGGASTITLASGASATDNLYRGRTLSIVGGTGAGQALPIASYVGSTKVATLAGTWVTNPASGSVYVIGEGPANVVAFGNAAGTFSSGRPEVNSTHWAGSAVAFATVNANVVQISGDTSAADNAESFFDGTGYAGTNNVIPTVTNLTNDPAGVGTLLTRLSSARAGYLDNLNVGGNVASSSQVSGLAVNTRANWSVPVEIEIPDSSTTSWKIRLHLFDEQGNMEAPDSTPTIALTNAAGTDRSSRLSAASNPSTGAYEWTYTATAGDAEEQLVWLFTVVEGGATRVYPATSYVVEETAYRFSSSDRSNLNAIKAKTDNLPADPADASDIASSFSTVNGTLATIDGRIDTEMAAALAILQKLEDTLEDSGGGNWIFTEPALANAPTGGGGGGGDATEANQTTIINHLTAMKGAGFDGSTDSLEAIRNRGDAAWLTATGFSTLNEAGVRTAVGLPSADLGSRLDAINNKTTNLPSDPADASIVAAAFDIIAAALATIAADTGTAIPGLINGLNDLSAADVNAQLVDVMATDTHGELSGVPAATASYGDMVRWLFMLSRDEITQTSSLQRLKNDAGTVIAEADLSDNGTAVRGKWGAP